MSEIVFCLFHLCCISDAVASIVKLFALTDVSENMSMYVIHADPPVLSSFLTLAYPDVDDEQGWRNHAGRTSGPERYAVRWTAVIACPQATIIVTIPI